VTTLALFDFDGTITQSDSFTSFVKFYHGTSKFLLGFIFFSPILILMKLGVVGNGLVKNMVFSYFFKGASENQFNEQCQHYSLQVLPSLLRPKAIETLNSHLNNSDDVVIVSASPENWIMPWAIPQGIRVISTTVEVKDGFLTGMLSSKNCYGPEKVLRIKNALDLSQYKSIVAYGDSKGDREMLELANESHYKPFRN
tara:strand:- start:42421 stop:43014 length:594 start_codon:yes stop_codon:yes gene_type:complete